MRRTSKHSAGTATLPPYLDLWQSAGLGPLNWLAPTAVARMQHLGAEWLGFVADRAREDVALHHALLHAKSPGEAQALQLAFLQKAITQYTAETGKMVDLGARLFSPEEEGPDTDNVNV